MRILEKRSWQRFSFFVSPGEIGLDREVSDKDALGSYVVKQGATDVNVETTVVAKFRFF